MTDKDTDLEIDPALRARLSAIAARSGTSLSDLTDAVLRAHANEQERLETEISEDEERWQQYLATGETIPYETVRDTLLKLASAAARRAQAR